MVQTSVYTLIISIILFSGLGFSAEKSEDAKIQPLQVKSTPISIQIPDELLRSMTANDLALLEQIKNKINSDISLVSGFQVVAPEVLLKDSAQIIYIEDFLKIPNRDNELYELSGEKLTAEQFSEIKNKGYFLVPSKEYPDMSYLWEVRFVEGIENINIKKAKRNDISKREFVVEIPRRIIRLKKARVNPFLNDYDPYWEKSGFKTPVDQLSVSGGVRQIFNGIKNSLALLVGIIEKKPKYSSHQVRRLALEATQQQTLKAVKEKVALESKGGFKKEGVNLDLRLYNHEVLSEIVPDLISASEANEREWELKEAEKRRQFSLQDVDVETALVRAKQATYYKHLNSLKLDDRFPGITLLIINHAQATKKLFEMENKLRLDMESAYKELKDTKEYLKFRDPERAQEYAIKSIFKLYKTELQSRTIELKSELFKQGLKQEALIIEQNVKFYLEYQSKVVKSLEEQKETFISKEYEMVKWSVTDKDVKQYSRLDEFGNEVSEYYIDRFKTMRVDSNIPFWRVKDFFVRSTVYGNNANYYILNRNLLNGPLGIKALFSKNNTFKGSFDVNESGKLVATDPVTTFMGHLKNYYKRANEGIAEFDRRPQVGLIPKRFEGVFVKGLKYNLGMKVLLPVSHAVVQPTVTVANAALSTAIATTTLVWAPLTDMTLMGFNALIFNYEKASREKGSFKSKLRYLFPLFTEAVLRPVFLGAGQMTFATAAATLYHPLKSTAVYTYGTAAKLSSKVKDTLMLSLLKKLKARVPEGNSWLAWVESGPGISNRYFFQVDRESALFVLKLKLDSVLLREFVSQSQETLTAPERQLREFKSKFGETILNQLAQEKITSQYEKNSNDFTEQMGEQFREKARQLKQIEDIYGYNRIALDDTSLRLLFAESEVLTENYFQKNVYPYMDSETKNKFWSAQKLAYEDWSGLAKKLLSDVFGERVLTSLEATDKAMSVTIKTPGVIDRVKAFRDGVASEKLEKSIIKWSQKKATQQTSEVYFAPAYNKHIGSSKVDYRGVFEEEDSSRRPAPELYDPSFFNLNTQRKLSHPQVGSSCLLVFK